MIALFYPEATIHLLTAIGKAKDIDLLLSIYREPDMTQFDEASLHPTIRTWMSVWIQSSQTYMTQGGMSVVLQNKLLKLLLDDKGVLDSLAQGLLFFFRSRNLHAEKRMMLLYAEHIIHEYIVALEKALYHSEDKELIET